MGFLDEAARIVMPWVGHGLKHMAKRQDSPVVKTGTRFGVVWG